MKRWLAGFKKMTTDNQELELVLALNALSCELAEKNDCFEVHMCD